MEKEIYGYIYLIKNIVNEKLYFGQTIKSFDVRYKGNLEKNTNNQHLKKSIEKYGIENFEIIKEFDIAYTKNELDKLEDMYICLYDTMNDKKGYNERRGGSRGRLSDSSRKKLSQSRKGENNPMYGKKLSEERRKEIGLMSRGANNFNARGVVCVETGDRFSTVAEAANWAGLSTYNSISNCCRGINVYAGKHPVTHKKLRWRYCDEVEGAEFILPLKEFKESNSKKIKIDKNKKVICLNTGEVFGNIEEAMNWCGVALSSCIRNVCIGRITTSGKHPITKERLKWRYVNELGEVEDVLELGRNIDYYTNRKKIICLNTSEIFNSAAEVNEKYGIDSSSVTKCCKGKRSSAGKLSHTGEKLQWQYYCD